MTGIQKRQARQFPLAAAILGDERTRQYLRRRAMRLARRRRKA